MQKPIGIALTPQWDGVSRIKAFENIHYNLIHIAPAVDRHGETNNNGGIKQQSMAGNRQSGGNKYRDGRWTVPSKRAKAYAADRKARVHTYGPKEGQELTLFEAGMRSGYLQAQNDHAGMYKYGQARDAGYSKAEAGAMSRKPWNQIRDDIAKKKGGR